MSLATVNNTEPSGVDDEGRDVFQRWCESCGTRFTWVRKNRRGVVLPRYCSTVCRGSTPAFVIRCAECGGEWRSHIPDPRPLCRQPYCVRQRLRRQELELLIEAQSRDMRISEAQQRRRGFVPFDEGGETVRARGGEDWSRSVEWRDPTFDAVWARVRDDAVQWELECVNRGHGYDSRDPVMRESEVMDVRVGEEWT